MYVNIFCIPFIHWHTLQRNQVFGCSDFPKVKKFHRKGKLFERLYSIPVQNSKVYKLKLKKQTEEKHTREIKKKELILLNKKKLNRRMQEKKNG